MSKNPLKGNPAGRLAVREIRDEVRFFYALPDTMKDALLLGTVKTALLQRDETLFDKLVVIYTNAVALFLEDAVGVRPDFTEPMAAPEHERGKGPWKHDA